MSLLGPHKGHCHGLMSNSTTIPSCSIHNSFGAAFLRQPRAGCIRQGPAAAFHTKQHKTQHHITRCPSVATECCLGPAQTSAQASSSAQVTRMAAGSSAGCPPFPAEQQCWGLVSRKALAGGMLEVRHWRDGRNIRVWLPPGYSHIDAVRHPYPVIYLNDGQNLFGDCSTMSGASWNAAQAAAGLITTGKVPPFIIVGIDHAGSLRSLEYTPCRPGTGPGGFRSDAADWPGGGVSTYLDQLQDELIPWVTSHYTASPHPEDRAFGGSSFGGIAALVAGMRGADNCGYGALLVESPSLWIGEEAFLQEILSYRGTWPARVYVGMGGQEFSGTRGGDGQEHDALFLNYLQALYSTLTQHGDLGPDRLAWTLDEQAGHTESAWAARLPAALQFIAGGWWRRWMENNGGGLFFTVPRRLKAGLSGQLLLFNRYNSHTLSQLPAGVGLKLVLGFNGWQKMTQLSMTPAAQVQQFDLKPPQQLQEAAMQKWQQQWATAATAAASEQGDGRGSSGSSGSKGSSSKVDPALQCVLDRSPATCGISSSGADWWVVQLPPLPADCYEVNMVFCDEAGNVYDNNNDNDFYLPVRQPQQLQDVAPLTPQQQQQHQQQQAGGVGSAGQGSGQVVAAVALDLGSHSNLSCQQHNDALAAAVSAAAATANSPAESAAAAAAVSGSRVCFSMPPVPVAGALMTLYCNRARLANGLAEAPNVRLYIGFNGWEINPQKLDLKPTSLWRDEGTDWWSVQVQVPQDVVLANFAFTAEWNGTEAWDNNWGHDYQLPITSPAAAAAAATKAAQAASLETASSSNTTSSSSSSYSFSESLPVLPPATTPVTPPGFTVREVESVESISHADGVLEVLTLKKRASCGGSSSSSSGSGSKQHWWDERRIRVWTPPGFSADAAPPGGWPALVMCDGQNMFEDWLAHQGVSWHLAYAASGLMSVGAIPPCLCIAIDSAGPYRSYNYLPFPPGTGQGGFRGDAARWPGGGAHDFLMRVEHEILPMLQQRYSLSKCPSRLAFGGGSFAGVTAVMAATLLPHVFGGILVESPSLWVAEGRYLQDLAKHTGRLPERLSLGCGTQEYSATRDHDRPDMDSLLLHQYHECVQILQEKGLRGPQRLKFLVEEGGRAP